MLGGFGELNHNLKGINNFVSVSHDIAESLSEVILDREVVEGGEGITNPVVYSEEEIVGVVKGFLEVDWEHGGESFLGEGDQEEDKSEELSDHLGETGVGALEVLVALGDLWGKVRVIWGLLRLGGGSGGHSEMFLFNKLIIKNQSCFIYKYSIYINSE